MTDKHFTSLALSKLLKENGCDLESEFVWKKDKQNIKIVSIYDLEGGDEIIAKAYDILWDMCIKYKYKFFGLIPDKKRENCYYTWVRHTEEILWLINKEKPQEEIEDFLWSICKFNPKNKQQNKE